VVVTPYYADAWLTVYGGDCLEVMRTMPADSVDCVVTSPPYWGLRDYGNDGQLGLERTPEEYVANMVAVFAEVRRVLKPSGTCWLNLGDSYAAQGGTDRPPPTNTGNVAAGNAVRRSNQPLAGLKPKDLVGIPWRVAFALQADGWYLRSDIIWSKPNPMPESVTDRPTKSHEYLFLLTKSARYYFDADAIREPLAPSSVSRLAQQVEDQLGSARANGGAKTNGRMKAVARSDKQSEIGAQRLKGGDRFGGFNERWDNVERAQTRRAVELARSAGLTNDHLAAIRAVGITDTGKARTTQDGTGKNAEHVQRLADEAKAALGGYYREFLIPQGRNARSVWTIPTQPYADAHFAVFPPELPERCIKAGSSEGGLVLDPFAGSGTVGMVANRLSRRAILIDLNPEYLKQQMRRNAQTPLGLVEPVA
jgi:DNA modification methylase